MIFNRISKFREGLIEQGTFFYRIVRDIYQESFRIYNEHKGATENMSADAKDVGQFDDSKTDSEIPLQEEPIKATKRKNLQKNLTAEEPTNVHAKQTSLNDHKAMDFPAAEKFNANMWQRNYENHQGN
jgi:hypothetical protein